MFQRKFPFFNFGRTWDLFVGTQDPRQTRKIELRVVCDTKGDAPFHSLTPPKPMPPRPTSIKTPKTSTTATTTAVASTSTAPPLPPPPPSSSGGPGAHEEVSIGRITITEKTTWSVLEFMIGRAFKRFLLKPTVYQDLGLSAESIYAWEIPSQILLEFKSSRDRPEIHPIHCIQDEYHTRVLIYLKGATQDGALDGMAFQLQMPKSILATHLAKIERMSRAIFCGSRFVHHRIEMSLVVRKFAEYLVIKERGGFSKNRLDKSRKEKEKEAHFLATFNAMDTEGLAGLGLAAFMEDVSERVRIRREGIVKGAVPPPNVALVENLQAMSRNLERIVMEFNDFRRATEVQVGYLLGTFVTVLKPSEMEKSRFAKYEEMIVLCGSWTGCGGERLE